MKYTPPKTPRLKTIRDMEPKTTFVFTDANITTIRSLVSRVKTERGRTSRKYRTKKHPHGAQIWRDK